MVLDLDRRVRITTPDSVWEYMPKSGAFFIEDEEILPSLLILADNYPTGQLANYLRLAILDGRLVWYPEK